jgi:MFS family permease
VGRKPIVITASALMAGALAALAFVYQLGVVLALGVVFGLALGAYMAVDWAMAIDVLPDPTFAAKDLGLWGLATSLPQTIAPLVGGAVLVVLAQAGAATGYRVLFLGAALCAAGSSFFIRRVRGVRSG